MFPLDTNGVHRILADQKELRTDKLFEYLLVKSDTLVQVFDLHSPDLRLLHMWRAPAPLRRETVMPAPGEFVVLTNAELFHLTWDRANELRVEKSYNFKIAGYSTSSIRQDLYDEAIYFKGPTTTAYLPERRAFITLAGVGHDDLVLGFDLRTARFIYWAKSAGVSTGTVRLSSFDGSWRRTICEDCDWNEVRYVPGSGIAYQHHSESADELLSVQLSWSGDALSSRRMKTSRDGRRFDSWGSLWSGDHLVRDELTDALGNAVLRNEQDTIGRVQRLLMPRSQALLTHTTDQDSGSCFVIYSDSLISEIQSRWTTETSSTSTQRLSCVKDSLN